MTTFTDKAPWIINLLKADFGLTTEDGAAIVGNLGHESGGFKYFQEIDPVVPGSRGGFGWCQWTGPRRVAFESYCKRNHLDPKSDRANYGYLFTELKGSEKGAIPAVKKAIGLQGKVAAFEAHFERAGVINMPSRMRYANQAMAAYNLKPAARPPYALDKPVPFDPPHFPPQPDDPGVIPHPMEPDFDEPERNYESSYFAIGGVIAVAVAMFILIKFVF